MSRYKVIQSEFVNAESLEKALKDMGLEFQKAANGQTITMKNRWQHGDAKGLMYAVNEESFRRVVGGHTFGSIGFEKTSKGFGLVIDSIDEETPSTKAAIGRLKQRYTYHEVRRNAYLKGYSVTEKAASDGTIRLVLGRR